MSGPDRLLAAAGVSRVDGVRGVFAGALWWWPVAAAVLVLAAVAGLLAAGRRRRGGVWRVFGDQLRMSGPGRAGLFAFLEVAILASALRARRSVRACGSVGVDGAAVWVLAGLSAVLSSLDSRGAAEVRLRVCARLAEPAGRGVEQVDRQRRVARLVRAAWRYHTLPARARRRRARAAGRLRRQTLAAAGHLQLGSDGQARQLVRAQLAALYQAETGTAPAAVADLAPWSASPSGPPGPPPPGPGEEPAGHGGGGA